MDDQQQWDDWLRQLADGDEQVVAEFWGEFGGRLRGLAAQHMKLSLQRRVDPEDVVQSACRTFLRRLQAGDFELAASERLWRLLCVITLAKTREQARFHQRGRRSIEQERSLGVRNGEGRGPGLEAIDRGPAPDEAAAFADHLERLLAGLDEEERRLVQLKLEDRTNEEIAECLRCSERTVRRMLNRVRSHLEAMLAESHA